MSRFCRIDNEPVYSEIKPERCPRHVPLGERQAREARRAYMEDVDEDELRYQQLRGNSKWR